MSVFVIAEAGVNHNGNLNTAKQLADAAREAGADAVKFQTFRAEDIVTASAPKVEYQSSNTGEHQESQFEMLKKLELSDREIESLFLHCREMGIHFLSTPFDARSADLLDGLGMDIFKVPSGEITNMPLIRHIASKKKPIILSTGMSYLAEVEKAVSWIHDANPAAKATGSITLLHCVSNYPAEFRYVNLRAMDTMVKSTGLAVGYSDHTMGIEAAVAATALGAAVIEKHLTINRTMQGPDHKASLEPLEFREMVTAIRNTEACLGDGIKEPAVPEVPMRALVRKSLVSRRKITAGETITPEMVTVKRPGTGIAPEFIDQIMSMKAVRTIAGDSVILWDDLSNA